MGLAAPAPRCPARTRGWVRTHAARATPNDAEASRPMEPGKLAGLVGEDVAEKVAGHNAIKLRRICWINYMARSYPPAYRRYSTSGYSTASACRVSTTGALSSTLALSTLVSFFRRLRAVSSPTRAMRSISPAVKARCQRRSRPSSPCPRPRRPCPGPAPAQSANTAPAGNTPPRGAR